MLSEIRQKMINIALNHLYAESKVKLKPQKQSKMVAAGGCGVTEIEYGKRVQSFSYKMNRV